MGADQERFGRESTRMNTNQNTQQLAVSKWQLAKPDRTSYSAFRNCDSSSCCTTILSMKRMTGRLLLAVILACSTGTATSSFRPTISCRTPANAKSCYWTQGRLYGANGNPAIRIWKMGTHRVLGVYSGPSVDRSSLDNENPGLPPNVKKKFKPFENRIVANFEVCPLETERAGWMQAVCIESAKDLVVIKD